MTNHIEQIEKIVRSVVSYLVRNEYQLVIEQCSKSRMTAQDFDEALSDYGMNLIDPPLDTYRDCLNIVRVRDTEQATYSVWAALWTREEGRSDLVLALTIIDAGDHMIYEIDDLHVP